MTPIGQALRRLAAMAMLGGLAQAAREGASEAPAAERLWRPAPPPRYGAWPKDFAAQQRRDYIADRRAADATAAAARRSAM